MHVDTQTQKWCTYPPGIYPTLCQHISTFFFGNAAVIYALSSVSFPLLPGVTGLLWRKRLKMGLFFPKDNTLF